MILDTKEKTRSLSQYSSTSSLASDNTRTTDSVSRVQQASRSHLSINKTTSELEAPPDYFPNTPYGTSPGAGPSSSSSSNSRRMSYVGPSLPPASNFTLIDRPRSAIKGVYVVDPSLCIPDSVLPPLEEGQTVRPNLKLKGYHNSVDVDVHLILPADAKNVPERVVIEIESYHASTTVRLYNMLPIPVTLKASSTHSSVKVYLPRSFRGLIEQSVKHGKSTLSEHVARVTRTYSEVKGKSVSFMGDPAGEGWDSTGQHWLGSTVTMSTSHSNAGIWYVDELERKKTVEGENRPNVLRKRGISGLFGRG